MDTNPRSIPHHLQSLWRSIAPQGRFAIFCLVTVGIILAVYRLPQVLQAQHPSSPGAETAQAEAPGVASSDSGNPYEYGIFPANADIEDARRAYTDWKEIYVNSINVPDPETMLRVFNSPNGEGKTTSEYQGYGMLYAAHLEDDDAVLEKLWNFAEYHFNEKGLMKWSIQQDGTAEAPSSALDGDVDIAMALDYAARRWPNRGWEERAETYLNRIMQPPGGEHLRTSPIDTEAWPRWKRGLYLNYLATAYMDRFAARTGDQRWVEIAIPNTYALLDYSYNNFALPAWFVDAEGRPVQPNDPWNSGANRHDTGATRTNWRIATHYLASGHPDAQKWAEKLTEFFYTAGRHWGSSDTGDFAPKNLRMGYRFMTTDKHTAGDPYGNRNKIAEAMIVAAGVPAMAAGQEEMTNEIYDFLAADPIEPDDSPMDNAMHVMGLLIMSGGLEAVQ